jgi:trk system potassium uptake protein TrkH
MGIIVFTIAVLPLLGIGGMQLFKAEVPGPVTDKLTPRVADTARQLWYIYVGLTLLAFLCLLGAGMEWFDAMCHALTTLSTGGFSTRNDSIASFHSPAVEWIMIAFMLAAGTNFALHFRLLEGQFRRVAGDRELHLYLALVVGFTLLVTASLWNPADPGTSLRTSAFQVVSLLTTAGFVTADYEVWPALAQFTMAHLLLLGGMAGSTSGGLKTLRLLLGLRALRTFVLRASHPNAVRPVRYAGRAVAEDVLNGVLVFFIGYGVIAIAAAAVVASAGYDVTTSFTAALTAIGNVGPGLGAIGPTDNFAHMPVYVKLVLSFCMIAGRLEIFTVLVLFEPHFWKR